MRWLGCAQYDKYVKRFGLWGKPIPFITITPSMGGKCANHGEIEPIKMRPADSPPQNPLETYATVLVFAFLSQHGQSRIPCTNCIRLTLWSSKYDTMKPPVIVSLGLKVRSRNSVGIPPTLHYRCKARWLSTIAMKSSEFCASLKLDISIAPIGYWIGIPTI